MKKILSIILLLSLAGVAKASQAQQLLPSGATPEMVALINDDPTIKDLQSSLLSSGYIKGVNEGALFTHAFLELQMDTKILEMVQAASDDLQRKNEKFMRNVNLRMDKNEALTAMAAQYEDAPKRR